MRTLLALFTLAVLAATTARSQTTADFQSLARLFDYDAKQPLDVQDKIIQEFPDGTLHDLTYTSPKGGPVNAYLIAKCSPPDAQTDRLFRTRIHTRE